MKKWISPIPKKVHFIWLGSDPPDYFQKYFLKSFEKNMSEFEIFLWTDKDLTKSNFPKTYSYITKIKKIHGQDMYDEDGYQMFNEKGEPLKYSKWAQITDLMRLEIVYTYGGYYFDVNFEILKPLYKLLNNKFKFVGCNEIPRFKNAGSLSNSFFGASKGNTILKRLLSKKYLNDIDIKSFEVANESGPGYLRDGIKQSDNFKIFPATHFYPFIEPFDAFSDPLYRKSSKNKCHKTKKTKKYKKLQNKKGYLLTPCNKYPKSYAIKHWNLGGSWTHHLNYVTYEDKRR